MAKKAYTPWARIVGEGFAHLQDGIDQLVTWGFRSLKSVDEEEEEVIDVDDPHPALTKAKKIGKGVLGFLGEAGGSYYETYEKLKKEKEK